MQSAIEEKLLKFLQKNLIKKNITKNKVSPESDTLLL